MEDVPADTSGWRGGGSCTGAGGGGGREVDGNLAPVNGRSGRFGP